MAEDAKREEHGPRWLGILKSCTSLFVVDTRREWSWRRQARPGRGPNISDVIYERSRRSQGGLQKIGREAG